MSANDDGQGNLFLVVKALVTNVDIEFPDDEATLVQMLFQHVQKHTTLMELYKDTLTTQSKRFIEAYLPLVGRILQNTIGLVDADNNIIHIPNQWLAQQTDDFPEIIKRTTSDDTKKMVYTIDFDEDYNDRYIELANTNQWQVTYDTVRIKWDGGNKQGAPSSSSGSSVPTKVTSTESIADAVNTRQAVLRLQSNYEQLFLNTWDTDYYFDAQDIPKTTLYPNPIHPNFHNDLYKINPFAFARIAFTSNDRLNQRDTITFADHQKYVRNFISPLSPYHSLLIVHSTGSGKTFTTFGITEQFRDMTRIQNKKIHITCPRREICDEFRSYFKPGAPPNKPQNYIYREYEKETQLSQPFHTDKHSQHYANQHYNIATYYSIFPKSYYTYIHTLQQVMCAWRVVLPAIKSMNRTPNGFLIVSPTIPKKHHTTLLLSFNKITDTYANALGERWHYMLEPTTDELHVVVSNIKNMVQFEKRLVDTYANTVFVIDEAHRINKDDGNKTLSIDTQTHNQSTLQNLNWTFILSFVISVLRYHRCRMRLLLLTATPMQNESQDVIRLLNLMIHNDGYKQEEPFKVYKQRKITQLSAEEKGRLEVSIGARISYFKDDRGKPTKLAAEDLFYNVPTHLDVDAHCGKVCPVLWTKHVDTFLRRAKEMKTPHLVWDQRKSKKRAHSIPLTALHKSALHSHQTYVYIVLHPHMPKEKHERWLRLCGSHLSNKHTVILLCESKSHARMCANDRLYMHLFEHTSVRRPFLLARDVVCSRYTTKKQPTIYAHQLSNLESFFATYLSSNDSSSNARVTHQNFKNTPSIVATPMQNHAFTTTNPKQSLRYNFVSHRINNWNVHDTTDRLYQPKIDTMLSLMETLPGNVLVYTNEVQLGKEGARALQFLKRLMEQRFRKCKHSRLRNVTVEILHKETLSYTDESDFANALNKRIQEINTKLLSKRNDIVLIGSTEIREGLTMDEIRQVHMLDVSWNIAQMQQIVGRAIRINNHRKCAHVELHNVSCFLHITVPETVVDEPDQTAKSLVKLSRMSFLERSIADLHRLKCMHNKIDDIVLATRLLQLNAFDIVFLNTETQKMLSVLAGKDADKDTCGWFVRKQKSISLTVLQAIQSKHNAFVATKHHTPVMHTEPKEIMRKEIDIMKREICVLMCYHRLPFLTHSEMCSHVLSVGRFKRPSSIIAPFHIQLFLPYYEQISKVYAQNDYHQPANILRTLMFSNNFPNAVKEQLALNILCCNYKWFVKDETDEYYVLQIDPRSILNNPEWLWTRPPPLGCEWSLSEIQKRSAPDCQTVLQHLTKTYAVLIDNQVDVEKPSTVWERLPKHIHPLPNVCLQQVNGCVMDCALAELIRNHTPIEYSKECFYQLVYKEPFYTLERLYIPTTRALWNVKTRTEHVVQDAITATHTPYSMPLLKNTQFTLEHIGDVIVDIERITTTLYEILKPVCQPIVVSLLNVYLAEYVFDSLLLSVQEAILRNVCIYGFCGLKEVCKLQASHVGCLRNGVFHRYCEKGLKSTDCDPERAQQLIKSLFVNRVGRVYCSLPLNPATEHCTVNTYSLVQSTGKDCTLPYQPYTIPIKKKALLNDVIRYFSPIPISKTNDGAQFYSSKQVHNASTDPLHKTTPLFGYNEVLNYKHKESNYFKMFLCTTAHLPGYEITSDEALQHLVRHDDEHHTLSPFRDSLRQTEATLAPHIETVNNSKNAQIHTKRLCRFLFLRHQNVFLRYFYSGIITKHPNREYYADYKHALKKKIL